jgi:Fe-S oxidoreductase
MQSQRFSKICPINAKHYFDVYSGQGLLDFVYGKLSGTLDYTPMLLDALNKCTLCGACDIMCKRNLDLEVIETIEELRARAYEDGQGASEVKAQVEAIRKAGNPWNQPRSTWDTWSEGLGVKDLNREKADTLYFVGVKTAYVPDLQRLAVAVAGILKKAGVDFGILGAEETDSGMLAFSAGDHDLAGKLAAQNVETFNKLGVKRVVVSSAAEYGMIKGRYRRFGRPKYEIQHISELMEELINAGKLNIRKNLDMKVTYHDPCFLGRRGEKCIVWDGVHGKFGLPDPPKEYNKGTHGIYEPPRNVLKNLGVELLEMERIRENAWCCGAGAAETTRTSNPDFSLWTASERLEEAEATGAEALVTCCPYCEDTFRETAKAKGYRIKIFDLAELVSMAT